jgi:ribosomal protein L13
MRISWVCSIGYQLPTIKHKMTISNYTRRSNKIQGNTYFHRLEPMEVYETIFHMFCNNTIQGNTYFHRLEVYETIFHMSCNNKIQGNTYFHRLEVYETIFHMSCNNKNTGQYLLSQVGGVRDHIPHVLHYYSSCKKLSL